MCITQVKICINLPIAIYRRPILGDKFLSVNFNDPVSFLALLLGHPNSTHIILVAFLSETNPIGGLGGNRVLLVDSGINFD